MAIKDDIAALQDATAAQDSVIGSLKTFIGGIPALIDAAVAAQEAGDDSALQDLATHIKANSDAISQAVVQGTSAAAPESGANDDPVVAAAAHANASNAQAEADNAQQTTYADNGDITPAASAETPPAPAAEPEAPVASVPDSEVQAGETPVPAERVAVDEDHQVPAASATSSAPSLATPNPDDAPLAVPAADADKPAS